MTSMRLKVLRLGGLLGFGVGMIMVLPCFLPFTSPLLSFPVLGITWTVIIYPAILTMLFWPLPCADLIMMATILLQWTLLGFLIGLWRCRQLQRKAAVNSDKA